jgi:hypothetical protein
MGDGLPPRVWHKWNDIVPFGPNWGLAPALSSATLSAVIAIGATADRDQIGAERAH